PNELTSSDRECWTRMLGETEMFSPFMTPEFVLEASKAIADVHILKVEDSSGPVAFLPFQWTGPKTAAPVANGLNEFQAAVIRPGIEFSLVDWLREAGISTLSYDHWTTSQTEMAPYHLHVGSAPYIDLSGGYEKYREIAKTRTSYVTKVERQQRQLERTVGPVRMELRSEDDSLFQLLLKWKSQQHHDTGVADIFQQESIVELLRRMKNTKTANFQGLYSVLFANDTPIAVNLSLATPQVAHIWFPSYDRDFGKYSPGIILFLEMAKKLSQQQVQRVDFGPGPQQYKRRLASDASSVAIGAVDCSSTKRIARRTWYQTRQWLKQNQFGSGLAASARLLSRTRQWFDWRKKQPT
ncbi:MAG: CelD/BcsL family acetyltransferase involved in cellulose biosynthesis, partial [Pirellulaceae bacterium]